jgi:hypothetical protein
MTEQEVIHAGTGSAQLDAHHINPALLSNCAITDRTRPTSPPYTGPVAHHTAGTQPLDVIAGPGWTTRLTDVLPVTG